MTLWSKLFGGNQRVEPTFSPAVEQLEKQARDKAAEREDGQHPEEIPGAIDLLYVLTTNTKIPTLYDYLVRQHGVTPKVVETIPASFWNFVTLEKVIEEAREQAIRLKQKRVYPMHLLLAILVSAQVGSTLLKDHEISEDDLVRFLTHPLPMRPGAEQ